MNAIRWLPVGPENPAALAKLVLTHTLATESPHDGILLLPYWETVALARWLVSDALAAGLPIKAVSTLTDHHGVVHDILIQDTDDAGLLAVVRA